MKHIDRHEKNISIWNDFVNCVDVQIVGAGLQNETRHRYNADGFNPTNTIQYVAKGRGFIEIAGKKHSVYPGCIFLVPAMTPCLYCSDDTDPYRYYWLTFQGEYANLLLKRTGLSPESPVLETKSRHLIRYFARVFETMQKREAYAPLQMLSDFYNIFAILFREQSENSTPPKKSALIAKALDYMQKNYQYDVTCQDICSHLFVNRTYFIKLFKQETGYTPGQYLCSIRISAAVVLLLDSELNLSQIAAAVGFTPLNFTQAFKTHMGMTPSEYRKKNAHKGTSVATND